jgi:pimeloyl-ACP methyl ester carboxylesterase
MAFWKAEDDTLINYEVVGNDPKRETLLLLPSMLGAITTEWRNFERTLAADYRLIHMDLRGHGRSENKAPDLKPDRMAQDIVGLLDHLQVQRAHIAGYSLGGYLGLMVALGQPRRVQTVSAHATKFYWNKEAAAKMRSQLDPDQMSKKVPAYADQLVQLHGARHWRELVRHAADLVSYLVNNGLTENMIGRLQAPVLISVGERDEMVPLLEAARLSRVLPNGELLVLPGVRHPFNSIRPVPFLPALQYFHQQAHKR